MICRIFHKTGGDKKSQYYPNPTYTINPSSSSPNTCILPFLGPQTLETPLHTLHNHHQPYFHLNQEPINPLFPLPPLPSFSCSSTFLPSFPKSPPKGEDTNALLNPNEEAMFPANWLETYIQNPFVYEMGFPLPGPGAPVYDVPLLGYTATGESGPLVSN